MSVVRELSVFKRCLYSSRRQEIVHSTQHGREYCKQLLKSISNNELYICKSVKDTRGCIFLLQLPAFVND